MSTTTTSAEAPQPRRRRLARYVPLPGRTPEQTGRPRPGTTAGAPAGRRPLVIEDRSERGLLAEARRRGSQAGENGTLDPWVLGSGDRVPYFAELASLRDAVVHRIGEDLSLREEEARLEDARAASDVTAGETETRLLEERLREAERDIDTTRRQLDLLAIRSSRWLRFRDRLRERVEDRWLRARFPDPDGPPGNPAPDPAESGSPDGGTDQGADPGDDWQSVATAGTGVNGASAAALREEIRAARRDTASAASGEGWEGLQTRPGLPRWLTVVLLAVIMAVEVPVYWVAYQPFHGIGSTGGDLLSGTLAISSAVVMLTLPHLAGLMLRWRSATGSPRSGWLPALSLLGVWGALTWLLGTLRAKFVMQHDTAAPTGGDTSGFRGLGGSSADTTTLVDRLHLSAQTVTWLFCALLLLSGGVGFLLGLFREHPFLDAFRTAVERRTGLQRRREQSIVATEQARAAQETAESRRQDRRDAAGERIATARKLYEAAAHEYLDGVMSAAKDPAVTESAMRLSQNWPLLPAAVRER
ncbi:hypothetical protein A6P39_010515 [Streptomyces sp. FXJ1.172]|uniref:hypothetical protein n=1 Tax=Streptomyces sp. FXJ1.172 TaxID=710705 RepID=UPI0008348905|nr:hypothetical protein [Streptomyces sp. FXJ1.172]WEO94403.1 hypothetical protein A6P39_010515 [Streptomyces sp. FXJ1.172]